MTSENANSEHGYGFQAQVSDTLSELQKEGYLAQVVNEFRIGEAGYLNGEQYYSPFLIQFNDRARWILYTTTSLRTDRIKGQQWDSDRIKNADSTISKSLLVYPDDTLPAEVEKFAKQQRKYETKYEYSQIDGIVPLRVLVTQIKERDDEILIDSLGSDCKPTKNFGRTFDFSGRNFEKAIAAMLSSSYYLSAIKEGLRNTEDGFQMFKKLINGLQVEVSNVEKINATAEKEDIGLLPSGGSPKTDVIVTITMKDGHEEYRTLTCKRTTKSTVSVHQYKADAMADLMDKDNEKLRELLRMFEVCPVQGSFPKECQHELEQELAKYLHPFCRWVLGGHGGQGSELQKANHVVTYNPQKGKLAIHTVDEYIDLAIKLHTGFVGTPFQWTYASKCRGKNIQLKMPVILD